MAVARSVLCPTLIGREPDVALLRDAVERTSTGHGGVVVLAGEAGVGKSRVGREALAYAHERDLVVLTGRAVEGGTSVPYRPLTEAFLGAFRSSGRPESPELRGFEGHLGRLVPAWQVDGEPGADESPVLLGEAVVRVLRVTARTTGAVLLIEDLHWADPETLAVVEYLADALADEPVLCVGTCRPDGALECLDRLRRHPQATVTELAPLNPDEIAQMVADSLGATDPPHHVVEFVIANSDGNPFHVEELLAGLVASDTLVFDGTWTTPGELTPFVPTDIARSIKVRMAAVDDTARRVIQAGALLGRRFDWNLLPAVAEVDGRAAVDALRRAVDAQLIEVDHHEFHFRHALTRAAVLAELLPPEREELARRALLAVEHAHPGLPGPWCELAAELAEAAKDLPAAAAHLVESARRALDAGALLTAPATAQRARTLARGTDLELDADERFVQAAAQAGRPADALRVGRPLVARMEAAGVAAERRVQLLVVLARAELAAGDTTEAHRTIERAGGLASIERLTALEAEVEAVAAHVALDASDPAHAAALAQAAVEHATAAGRPDVACEALEVLGRVQRLHSHEQAIETLERAAALAEAHDLVVWELRARHELALERWVDGDTTDLRAVRNLAARQGAMVTVAVMDLALADVALTTFDRDACLHHARACVDASRRYGLATLPVAELWLAGAHALADDAVAMEAAAARALERDPDDPRILGDLWGRVRATLAMVRDDRDSLRDALDRMMHYVGLAPVTTSIYPNRLLWVLLRSTDDDDLGRSAQGELSGLEHLEWWTTLDEVLDLARAVTLGRQGRAEEATRLARDALTPSPQLADAVGTAHYLHLVLAEAQIRDGWGEPVTILRPAEAFFAARGYDAIARRCRVAMGRAGAKMPRRGRGDSPVPERLRAFGITSRELDVLHLIVAGRSNREIADQLHLSPKTVERHVSSLFDRTGIRNRTDLAAWVVHDAI